MVAERRDLSSIPPAEQRFLFSESYGRNGVIPGWTEVVSQFDLQTLPRGEFRLARAYYRVQQRLAKGQETRARELMRLLDKHSNFVRFEKKEGTLLSSIAHYVRGATERAAKIPILSSSVRR